MSTPNLKTEAAAAGNYPEKRFNQRERKLLQSVAQYAQAGKHETVGGDATEVISVSGATSADVAIVTMQTEGASPVSVVKAIAGTGTITVTLSADPADDHVLCWALIKG
jgi:hypothetical protein